MIRLCILASLAVAPAAALAAPAAEKSCVRLNRVTEQRIVDDRTIMFREDRRWYANDVGPNCGVLRPDRTIQSRTPSPNLCEGETVAVSRPSQNVEYGSCQLGKFVAVAGPAAARTNEAR